MDERLGRPDHKRVDTLLNDDTLLHAALSSGDEPATPDPESDVLDHRASANAIQIKYGCGKKMQLNLGFQVEFNAKRLMKESKIRDA
jgi:hypothetical protein